MYNDDNGLWIVIICMVLLPVGVLLSGDGVNEESNSSLDEEPETINLTVNVTVSNVTNEQTNTTNNITAVDEFYWWWVDNNINQYVPIVFIIVMIAGIIKLISWLEIDVNKLIDIETETKEEIKLKLLNETGYIRVNGSLMSKAEYEEMINTELPNDTNDFECGNCRAHFRENKSICPVCGVVFEEEPEKESLTQTTLEGL